jgi:uncharacterized membrane protein
MTEPLLSVPIPGLLCTPRLYAEQILALWRRGPVTIADHTRVETMAAIAARIALAGLSMGGSIAFEITA